jgi:sodium/potassium-transporting ATPase subunit alpha
MDLSLSMVRRNPQRFIKDYLILLIGNIVNSIGMVVCFIPEGLPAAVTLVLTIVAKRMYKQKVMVKTLATVETFNYVSVSQQSLFILFLSINFILTKVIATDKTGTLTMNQMTVTALLWGNEGEYLVPIHSDPLENATPENEQFLIGRKRPSLNSADVSSAMKDLILGACLCNTAVKQTTLNNSNNNEIDNPPLETNGNNTSLQTSQLVGDAADVALYNLCNQKCSVDVEQVKKVNPRINIVPFNSKNKFMITANILEQTSNINDNDTTVLVTLKGAPDYVLSRCSTYKQDNGDEILPMNEQFRYSIQQRQEAFGKSGYRVIAMIQQKMTKTQYDRLIETYKQSKNKQQQQQIISDESDLNGLPVNNYCFIGK